MLSNKPSQLFDNILLPWAKNSRNYYPDLCCSEGSQLYKPSKIPNLKTHLSFFEFGAYKILLSQTLLKPPIIPQF